MGALRFTSVAAMPPKLQELVSAQGKGADREQKTKKRKYNNQPTKVDGIRFDSKREAEYYQELKFRQAAGEVSHFLRQVPMHLPDGTKYVLDFLVFYANAAEGPDYVDVKGKETAVFRMKKRAVEFHYPIRLKLV